MKSTVIMPSYMQDFRCIASECEETCCAGWYIAIDEATYKKYKKVKVPAMKKRLEKELVVKKGQVGGACAAKIKLKNNRCAFLAQDNLCDIYTQLGESYLSETCQMYPRNTNQIGDRIELSLALSCPEAARQILLGQGPIGFSVGEVDKTPIVGAHLKINIKEPKHFEDFLLSIRKAILEVLQNECLTFKEKWQCLEVMMTKLNECKLRQDTKKLQAFLKAMEQKEYLKYKTIDLSLSSKKLLSSEGATHLFQALTKIREAKKWPSLRYEGCYEKMVARLGEPFSKKAYEQGEKIYEEVFIQHFSYILENYFVNYVYERLVPLNKTTPLESFKEMTLYLALLKLHLIGECIEQDKVHPTQVVTCIQSFTRVFDHNELYMQQIKKFIKE